MERGFFRRCFDRKSPTRTGAAERGKGVNVQVFVFGVPEKFNARP